MATSRKSAYEIYQTKTGDTLGRSFPTKREADAFVKQLQSNTSLKLFWKARKVKQNPAKLPIGKFIKVDSVRVHPGGKKVDIRFRKR